MKKSDIVKMTNEELISTIAWDMFKPTKVALKEQEWCVEELAKRGIVNAKVLMEKIEL